VIAKMVLNFFKLFPQGRRALEEEIEMAEAYAGLLKAYSLPTIDTCLRKITLRGDTFVPSAPQMVAVCEQIEDRHVRPEIFRALPPPGRSPEERARTVEGFANLLAELLAGRNFTGSKSK
jgi:hypothetical protein